MCRYKKPAYNLLGGKVDASDRHWTSTALREFQEECGSVNCTCGLGHGDGSCLNARLMADAVSTISNRIAKAIYDGPQFLSSREKVIYII